MTTIEVPDKVMEMLESFERSSGRPKGEVLEAALREYFRLQALEALHELQTAFAGIAANEEEAEHIAVEEVRAYRRERAGKG